MRRDDWDEVVRSTHRLFVENDGPATVEETRGRLRLELLEVQTFTGEQTGSVLEVTGAVP
jgi:hypothetical protein